MASRKRSSGGRAATSRATRTGRPSSRRWTAGSRLPPRGPASRGPGRVLTARRGTKHGRQSRVDDQQQQRMNRAAQEFTDALVAAYRTASDNTAAAQAPAGATAGYHVDGGHGS